MNEDHSRAYKVIVFMGVAAFALLWATSIALRTTVKPDERERVQLRGPHSPFDASSALETAQALRASPSTESGPAALEAVQDWYRGQARRRSLVLTAGPAQAETAPAATPLLIKVPGQRMDSILYVTFYTLDESSKLTVESTANLAFMLEWGASLTSRRSAYTSILACLYREPMKMNANVASAALTRLADQEGLAETVAQASAVVLLDNVGDCYLGYRTITGSAPGLEDAVTDAAQRTGLEYHFQFSRPLPASPPAIEKPFILLVDFQPPMSTIESGLADDEVCEKSLMATADVLHQALPALEHQLDRLRISQ